MMRPRSLFAPLAPLILCVSGGAVSAQDGLPETRFTAGGEVGGSLDFPGDVDEARFPALAGMKVRITPLAGGGRVIPVVSACDSEDRGLGTAGPAPRPRSNVAAIRSTGEYRLRISGDGDTTGNYTVATLATFPKSARQRTAIVRPDAESMTASMTVDLLAGARLFAFARPSAATPTLGMRLLRPDGTAVDLTPFTFVNGRRVTQLTGYTVDQTGTFRLELTGFSRRTQRASVQVAPWQPGMTGTPLGLVESLLLPADQPVTAPATYGVDPGLVIGNGGDPLGVATAVATGTIEEGTVALDGLRPDLTQVNFLTLPPSGEGATEPEPFAPFVVRPADAGAVTITVDAPRIALGVVCLHPRLARLTAGDRERLLDFAATAPSFEYLVAAIRYALATDPLRLSDATRFPEVFKSAGKVVEEALAATLPAAEAFRLTDGSTGLAFLGSEDGTARIVNPRSVFYGLRIEGPGGRVRMDLVAPRSETITAYPPLPGVVGSLDLTLQQGRTTILADAILPSSVDLSTAGGVGTTANGLCTLYRFFFQVSPWPMAVSPEQLAEMSTRYLLRSGSVPSGAEMLAHMGETFATDDPASMLDGLAEVVEDHWSEVGRWIWRGWPGGPQSQCLCGAARFVRGFVTLNALQETAPFLADLVRLRTEPQLSAAFERSGPVVVATPETPFAFLPDFGFTPAEAVIGVPAAFDPSATTFTAEPPAGTTYVWTFFDLPGAEPVVVDQGTSAEPVNFTFTTAGFHPVFLDVTAGGATQRAFRTVYASAFTNLGFDDGTTDGWTVETHTWDDPTPVEGHSAVVGAGFDPIAPALPTVFAGPFSLRIEDEGGGAYISSASRTLRVPAGGTILKFAWAAVLEDPGHEPAAQPFFDIRVTDATTGTPLYTIHHYANEPGFPWQAASWNWLYVPWQPVTLDLTALGGHDVIVSAIAGDCDYGGHGGYVYLDAP